MAKTGYLFLSRNFSTREEDLAWMKEFGCVTVIEEDGAQEKLRPLWRHLLTDLVRGDELVVSKLSNALRGIRELGAFLEMCRVMDIRIVSIHDGIDSKGELFPATSVGDVLATIGRLSAETTSLRRSEARVQRMRKKEFVPPKTRLRLDKEKMIAGMYLAGHHIDDIWRESGYRSRTSVFRVLKRAGVELNRKPTSGVRHESNGNE